jgi:ABC-type glutathione transport system ATPase component
MEAAPVTSPASTSQDATPLLAVRDLVTRFSVRGTFLDRLRGREAGSVRAVDGVSFDLRRGEVLGLVG